MNEQQQFGFLDMITVFTAILQMMDYSITVDQASNDDILRELRQDMTEIRNQNKAIIDLLKKQDSTTIV